MFKYEITPYGEHHFRSQVFCNEQLINTCYSHKSAEDAKNFAENFIKNEEV